MPAPNRWLALAILSSGLLLIAIDMTVLYTALPRLTHDLGASASEKLWIVNGYALTVAGLLPGSGTLGDRLGHKKLFLAGLSTFGLASLVAAFAPDPRVLIAGRVLLGVGAAMMMPATLSIIRHIFEDERERAFAIGVWAAVASGGAAFGPVVGGLLLEYFWWGSVFLVNLPIALVALVLAARVIPDRPGNPDRPWDPVGSVQVMIGLVGVAYAIKETGKRVASPEAALIAALIGILALALFVRRQLRSPAPMIDFALFRDARFSSAVIAALAVMIALIGIELVLTQRLQLVLGLSPLEAALLMLPIPLAAFFAGPLSGLLVPRLGVQHVLWLSLLLSGVGIAGILLARDAGGILQAVAFIAAGTGVGSAMTAASNGIMSNAPADRAGMAASIEEVSYELGGSMGIALLGSLLAAVYTATFMPPDGLAVPDMAWDSLDEAIIAAEALAPDAASGLLRAARAAFDTAFAVVLGATAAALVLTAAAIALHSRRRRDPAAAGRHRPLEDQC
jgi:MFS transporter, DHA2 family, multidrug resistance protein